MAAALTDVKVTPCWHVRLEPDRRKEDAVIYTVHGWYHEKGAGQVSVENHDRLLALLKRRST